MSWMSCLCGICRTQPGSYQSIPDRDGERLQRSTGSGNEISLHMNKSYHVQEISSSPISPSVSYQPPNPNASVNAAADITASSNASNIREIHQMNPEDIVSIDQLQVYLFTPSRKFPTLHIYGNNAGQPSKSFCSML